MGIEVIISDENGVSIDRHETTAKLMRLEYYLNRVSKRQKQLKKVFQKQLGYEAERSEAIQKGLTALGVKAGIQESQ
tara:strand:- start:962 stop:1192 length:231 start_codon:yes stop_codon:yes gene_type:complete